MLKCHYAIKLLEHPILKENFKPEILSHWQNIPLFDINTIIYNSCPKLADLCIEVALACCVMFGDPIRRSVMTGLTSHTCNRAMLPPTEQVFHTNGDRLSAECENTNLRQNRIYF